MIRIVLVLFLVSCGILRPSQPASPNLMEQLEKRIENVRLWAPICQHNNIPFVCKHPLDGDAILWNGLLCFVGKDFACTAVRESFSEDGKPNRSPYWRFTPRVENSFSRDMLKGLIAYLLKTRDTELALRFQNWVQANQNRLCLDATDGRCNITPTSWGLLAHVWSYLGLPLWGSMASYKDVYTFILATQAEFTETGYPSHLVATHLIFCEFLGLRDRYTESAREQLKRIDPRNPLFIYLSEGKSEAFAVEFLHQAPENKPDHPDLQWSIERHSSYRAWERSVGWEWIYLWMLIKEMESWTK